jgi:succinate dehydrogenase/fumarate reductase flavoprotein subunit
MPQDITVQDVDVLVVGGGLAGVYAAIRAREGGASKVVQVDKGRVGKSGCSCFAAGVMHTYFPQEDDLEDRVRRLVRAQGYLAQQDIMADHMEQSWPITNEMADLGVDFVRTGEGALERRPGRGSYPIISFYGPQLMDAMRRAAVRKGVQQIHRVMVTDLLTYDGGVVGAVGFDTRSGDFYIFQAKATVLATGDTWYKGRMPGHRDCSGDGYAAAYRAGAVLSGVENSDAPTNVMPIGRYDIGPGMNKFVGEGGIFINARGERFMERYNPTLKERSGLRFLTYAMCMEARQGNTPLFMDMTHLSPEAVGRLKAVLPLAMKMFESVGLVVGDRFVEPVEWMPQAPVGRPGLVVNRSFESTLPGLYGGGEVCAPQAVPMGLSAAATSGATAGASAARRALAMGQPPVDRGQLAEMRENTLGPLQRGDGMEPDQVLLALQEVVIPYDILLLRHGERMRKALEQVEDIRDNQLPLLCAYDPHYLRMAHEARNLTLVAELHLRASLMRTESRLELREDYPYQDNVDWLKWIKISNEGGSMKLLTEGVPIDSYPLKVERSRSLNHMWQLAEKEGIVTIGEGGVKWA